MADEAAEGEAPAEAATAEGEPAETAKEQDAGGDAAPEADRSFPEVPDELNLLHFLHKEDLSDCVLQLPSSGSGDGAPAAELPCHRLALCAGSGYFFRVFQPIGAEPPRAAALPSLPPDRELRRLVEVGAVLPLALRYLYGGQDWDSVSASVTSENAVGLYVVAELLEMRPLARSALAFLDASFRSGPPGAAVPLLYATVRLSSTSDSLASARARCCDVVRGAFAAACQRPEDLRLLALLPVDVLAPMLEADDLQVPSEGVVLHAVRAILRSRLPRPEAQLCIASGARLSAAPLVLPRLAAAAFGVIWEVFVVEDSVSEPSETPEASEASVAKYGASTAPLRAVGSASGDCEISQELALRVPRAAAASGAAGPVAGRVLLRAYAATGGGGGSFGEVLLAGELPSSALPQVSESAGSPANGVEGYAEASATMRTPAGEPAGVLHFQWRLGSADEAVGAASKAAGTAAAGESPEPAEEAAGETAAAGDTSTAEPEAAKVATEAAVPAAGVSTDPDLSPMSPDEALRLVRAVRLPHVEHRELLLAVKDQLLMSVPSVQAEVLQALSARLEPYEAAGAKASAREPRPSTCPGNVVRGAGAAAARGRGQTAFRRSNSRPSVPPAALPLPVVGAAGYAMSTGSASGRGTRGAALAPCGACGQGSLSLRQLESQWVAQCSRHPNCQNTVWLPPSVTAAAVDGHCASCTLRLRQDVRTLTVRLEMRRAAALLPSGVDTLRGVCCACGAEVLSRLGATQ
eukprot:TRINITY_DN12025_c0_g1_i1.p1 TRINITY_DN12025_c0_g1~~TRINITY_DN12025_c0_g1_i1.p1  ORF type:complete len:833 (+),score=167.19 TRINITY_DN12025_c0_g1_i1:250-2499(+)